MKISDIIFKEEYLLSLAEDNWEFKSIVTDPERVDEDSVLIIPNSEKFGRNPTLPKKPVAVVCDAKCILPENIPVIRVNNSRLALANAFYRFEKADECKMKIIGVTGTNGKSTTALFLKTILSKCNHKVGLIGTGKIEIDGRVVSDNHYSMTTPDPALLYKSIRQMADEGCDTVVMEVSSHALALDKVAPLTFDYALFTNFSSEHLDFHGSKEEYFLAKSKLFSQCKCGVFNIDDEYGRRAYGICKARRLSAGIIWRGDLWASNIDNHGLDGVSYLYHGANFSSRIDLKLAGVYNVYNSMLAATVCIDMGCKPCDVKGILGEITYLPGRFEIIKDRISVIIDYAHTDSAFDNVMKELSSSKGNKKLTVLFGCGGNRDKAKRPKMAEIAEKYANKIIITSDNARSEDPKDIISDIIRGFKRGNFEVIENRRDAIRAALLCANDGDIVAIIGKGPEKYNIDINGYSDFDEKQIVLSSLEERRAIR